MKGIQAPCSLKVAWRGVMGVKYIPQSRFLLQQLCVHDWLQEGGAGLVYKSVLTVKTTSQTSLLDRRGSVLGVSSKLVRRCGEVDVQVHSVHIAPACLESKSCRSLLFTFFPCLFASQGKTWQDDKRRPLVIQTRDLHTPAPCCCLLSSHATLCLFCLKQIRHLFAAWTSPL